jgi:predicted nicotinamide N-methyase
MIQDYMGIEGTGGTVWRASVMLAHCCCKALRDTIRGANVLEVGAGLGLVSIAAWHLGAARVVAADIDEGGNSLLALLARNVNANCASSADADSKADDAPQRRPPLVKQLWWGNDAELRSALVEGFNGGEGGSGNSTHSSGGGGGTLSSGNDDGDGVVTHADVVLACDILAWPESYAQLKQTLRGAAGERGVIVLAHQLRSRDREVSNLGRMLNGDWCACAHCDGLLCSSNETPDGRRMHCMLDACCTRN